MKGKIKVQKVNYQKILDSNLAEIKSIGNKANLLLHCCCAPCATYVTEYISEYFNISAFYFNPNIYPEEEYNLRLNELKKFSETSKMNFEVIAGEYNHESFYKLSKNLANEPEGKKRCELCIKLRLEETAKKAKLDNFEYFTTSLSVSPHKNADFINKCGKELSEIYGVKFLCADFKKKEGYKRSIELSRKYNLYRQNYCGCEFSMR